MSTFHLPASRRRRSELEVLGARKKLSEEASARLRELMVSEVGVGERRPHIARILQSFEASEDWQLSVQVGETVAVLDKRPDGWWVIDKSCGEGRGPFGLVPGMRCCWTLPDEEESTEDAQSSLPKLASSVPLNPSPGPSTSQPTLVAQVPEDENVASYTPADLDAAYAYLDKLINGDGFQACPPANFNDLCLDQEFADLVRARASHLRNKRRERSGA